jgi:hypothetical protein
MIELVRRPKVMGKLVVTGSLYRLGWATAAAPCIVGIAATMFMGSSS